MTGSAGPVGAVLDADVLDDLRELGDVVGELLASHDLSFRAGLSELSAAAACGDAPEVARLAHYLKGSSSCLAAQRVAALCADLQAAAARGTCPGRFEVEALRGEHQRSLAALAEEFPAGGSNRRA